MTLESGLEALWRTGTGHFGSAARGDVRPDSDVDVMIEFFPDVRYGLECFDIERELGEAFGKASRSGYQEMGQAPRTDRAHFRKPGSSMRRDAERLTDMVEAAVICAGYIGDSTIQNFLADSRFQTV